MPSKLIALVLFAAVAGPVAGDEAETAPVPPVRSPADLLGRSKELDFGEDVAVRFRVGTVDTMPVTGPDRTEYRVTRLHPDTDADLATRKSFHVALSPEVVAALRRLGIRTFEEHFVGRTVEIRGTWQVGMLNLPRSEQFRFYHVIVDDLGQFVSVGAEEEPPMRPAARSGRLDP